MVPLDIDGRGRQFGICPVCVYQCMLRESVCVSVLVYAVCVCVCVCVCARVVCGGSSIVRPAVTGNHKTFTV